MKGASLGLGILLLVIGLIWIGQGLNIIKGSVMTGEAFWGWMGLLCVAAGAGLLGFGIRGRKSN